MVWISNVRHRDFLSKEFADKLAGLSKKLMDDFDLHSRYLTNNYKKYGTMTIQSFQPRLSKPVIDEIDRAIAPHYNLSPEELDFIISFDHKYRMGQDDEEEAEDDG